MKVLVTAIGSMSAECVIGTLGRLGIDVVATDIYPRDYHPVAKKCCAFYQVPRVYPNVKIYCETLKELAIKESCGAIIPLTDPEVDVLSESREMFETYGIKIWLAADNVIKKARNKGLWCQLLQGCKYLKTIPSYKSYAELKINYSGEFVAKKVKGRSSEGILFSNTSAFHDRADLGTDYLFQPKITGDILTVDFAKHPKSGQLVLVPRVELMRTKNGAGTVVKITEPEVCKAAVFELADGLGLTGVMNCEFIRGTDGLYLMDINPRFSAGVSFSQSAGYNFVKADVDCFCSGFLDEPVPIAEGKIFVKRFCDF